MILEDFGNKSRVMEKAAGMLQFLNAIFVWFQKYDFTKITGPNDWIIVISINNARLPKKSRGQTGSNDDIPIFFSAFT